jgi:glutathione S-transferase
VLRGMSRQLCSTVRSPFTRKVRILLLGKALPCEPKTIELAARTQEHPKLVQWAASFAQPPSVLAAPPPMD